jgi:glycosidase
MVSSSVLLSGESRSACTQSTSVLFFKSRLITSIVYGDEVPLPESERWRTARMFPWAMHCLRAVILE